MKDKMQGLLNKIKPYLRNKRLMLMIGISAAAVVFIIIAIVSGINLKQKIDAYEKALEKEIEIVEEPTATPEITATPVPTTTAVATAVPTPTATAKATEEASSSHNNSETVSNGTDPVVPDKTVTSNSNPGPTGAPKYTPVPEESVSTKAKAYRTLVESCSGSLDYSRYYLYDMDRDGVEEFILHHGTGDTESTIDIYTFSEEGLVFVGDLIGGYAAIAGNSQMGLVVYYRRGNFESIENPVKTYDELYINTIVAAATVTEYTVLEGHEDLTGYRLDDLSPIK